MTTQSINTKVDRVILKQLPLLGNSLDTIRRNGTDKSIALDVANAKLISGTLSFANYLGVKPGSSGYAYAVYYAGVIAADMVNVTYEPELGLPGQLAALLARASAKPHMSMNRYSLSMKAGTFLGGAAYKGGQVAGGVAQTGGIAIGGGLQEGAAIIGKYIGKIASYL